MTLVDALPQRPVNHATVEALNDHDDVALAVPGLAEMPPGFAAIHTLVVLKHGDNDSVVGYAIALTDDGWEVVTSRPAEPAEIPAVVDSLRSDAAPHATIPDTEENRVEVEIEPTERDDGGVSE